MSRPEFYWRAKSKKKCLLPLLCVPANSNLFRIPSLKRIKSLSMRDNMSLAKTPTTAIAAQYTIYKERSMADRLHAKIWDGSCCMPTKSVFGYLSALFEHQAIRRVLCFQAILHGLRPIGQQFLLYIAQHGVPVNQGVGRHGHFTLLHHFDDFPEFLVLDGYFSRGEF